MNWEQIEGQWLQFTGSIKSTWGKLTDDDLTQIAGRKDQLVGKVKERYGLIKEDAETQVDHWLSTAKIEPTSQADTPSKS